MQSRSAAALPIHNGYFRRTGSAALGAEAIELARPARAPNHGLAIRILRRQAHATKALGHHAEAGTLALQMHGRCVAAPANCTRSIELLANLDEAWHAADRDAPAPGERQVGVQNREGGPACNTGMET